MSYTEDMKLIAQIQLKPTHAQAAALTETVVRANDACNYISLRAWDEQTFNQYALHNLVYHEVKCGFELGAQMVVRLVAKVAGAYKLDQKRRRAFKPHGCIAFDNRILSFKEGQSVSIWTVSGRQQMQFACGARQARMLEGRKGQSGLVYSRGKWFLHVACDAAVAPMEDASDYLGVDLGVVNIAADSDGSVYSGDQVEAVRSRNAALRAALQARGTRSAKRHLKAMAGREARFRRDTNHKIAKVLVARAKGTARGVALENLKGIRERTTVRSQQRAKHCGWSFHQLQFFVSYKAAIAGVPVVLVNPRDTSRICSRCGHCEKANRKSQSEFVCKQCGFSFQADLNAARNIRARALVNAPIVAARSA